MPPSLSPDVLPTIDTLVDRNVSREQIVALGAQQIRRLREDLRAGANMTPEQQRKLERLQAIIGTRISLIEAAAELSDVVRKDIVAELQGLREVMDKRFILPDYTPENTPDVVRKTLQFTAGSLDVGMRTLNAATRELPTVARVGIFAGAGVATALALKWMWDELGLIGKTVATGVAGSLGFLGFQKLQENWSAIGGFFRNIRDGNWLPDWMTGRQSNEKQQQEKLKKQTEITELAIKSLNDRPADSADRPLFAKLAIDQIQIEIGIIQAIPGSDKANKDRMQRLITERDRLMVLPGVAVLVKAAEDKAKADKAERDKAEKDKVEKNKEEKDKAAKDAADKKAAEAKEKLRKQTLLKESTKQFVDALSARAEGALLTSPPWRLNTAGMELEMGPDRIFVRRSGTLFRVGVTMIVSGNPHTFDLNQLHRFNVNPQTPHIRFNALSAPFTKAAPNTAKVLRSGLSPEDVAPVLAEAMVHFQGGGNVFEKDITVPLIGTLIGRLRINLEEVR